MKTGSASITIARPAAEVYDAIADVTRTGQWSPECIGCRWVDGATGPTVGARFEGDNEARIAGRVVKRWTTTSEVTVADPGRVFEFVAEGFTRWRYELRSNGAATEVTESFTYDAQGGLQGFFYDKVLRRSTQMTKGMQTTLERIRAALEA